MSNDTHMTRLEKVALTSAVSGAVFNVFLFGIGSTLTDATTGWLFIARVIAAIVQAAAFDLVAIATVMGMRHGRRGRWSLITAWASALVSAAIALDVAGVAAMPWLHAANALIVLAFTLHLLTPKALLADERQRLIQAEQTVAALEQRLNSREQDVAALEQRLNSREQMEVVYVATFALTWQKMLHLADQLRQADGISESTLRRRVAEIGKPVAALNIPQEV